MTDRRQSMVLIGAYAGLWTVASLAPFDLEPRSLTSLIPAFGSPPWFPSPPSDIVVNILLGAPFGALVARLARHSGFGRGASVGLATLATAATGTCIEIAQLFVQSRISTPFDVLSQSCGAVLAATLTVRPLPSALSRHWQRVRAQGVARAATYYVFTGLCERAGLEILRIFEFPATTAPSPTRAPASTRVVTSFDDLSDADKTALMGYGGAALLADFSAAFARGERCGVTYVEGGSLASVCWMVRSRSTPGGAASPCVVIERCFTLPAFRGRGLYPLALASLVAHERADNSSTRVVIASSVFNHSSIAGIRRAGFMPVGRLVRFLGLARYQPLALMPPERVGQAG